jgi:A/G-specific adenine glycosylase
MEVVLPYHERFVRRFPTVRSLADATGQEVLALWSGLGYYRRATLLHEGAQAVVARFGGRIPSSVEELLSIPGVGRYTAGAISSIAFDRHAPIVDGNVTRLLSRVFAIELPLGSPSLTKTLWAHADAIAGQAKSPRALSQGLMELGASVCTPRSPSCDVCPLKAPCKARAAARTGELPVPKAKRETKELRIPLYIVTDSEGRVLMRREEGQLMRSMYHLPHGDESLLPGHAFDATTGECLGSFRHTVTDRRIEFTVYEATLRTIADRGSKYEWVAPSQLGDVPHPSYVSKALRLRRRVN